MSWDVLELLADLAFCDVLVGIALEGHPMISLIDDFV